MSAGKEGGRVRWEIGKLFVAVDKTALVLLWLKHAHVLLINIYMKLTYEKLC